MSNKGIWLPQKGLDNTGGFVTGRPTYGNGYSFEPSLDFRLQHAIDEIKDTYGDTVLVKPKSLSKFGQNELVGTDWATLMTLPAGTDNETYATSNSITHISSSDTGDDQVIRAEGHYFNGDGDLVFHVQFPTVNGQNKVQLDQPLARFTRIRNNGATDFAGNIYGFEDDTLSSGVPTTDAKVHIIAQSGDRNTSFKASTTVSYQDYWLITSLRLGVDKKTSASVDVELQVRNLGGVFISLFEIPVNTTGTNAIPIPLDPVVIVPKNSDVRLRARASTTAVSVSGRMAGYLALVQNG